MNSRERKNRFEWIMWFNFDCCFRRPWGNWFQILMRSQSVWTSTADSPPSTENNRIKEWNTSNVRKWPEYSMWPTIFMRNASICIFMGRRRCCVECRRCFAFILRPFLFIFFVFFLSFWNVLCALLSHCSHLHIPPTDTRFGLFIFTVATKIGLIEFIWNWNFHSVDFHFNPNLQIPADSFSGKRPIAHRTNNYKRTSQLLSGRQFILDVVASVYQFYLCVLLAFNQMNSVTRIACVELEMLMTFMCRGVFVANHKYPVSIHSTALHTIHHC